MDPAHHALSKELRTQLAARGGSFAPRFQIYKAAFIWAAAVALEAYALCVQRTWVGAAVLGFLFAQIGLNIQHDANHGAMFKNGLWNVAWGLSQNWIGGSQASAPASSSSFERVSRRRRGRRADIPRPGRGAAAGAARVVRGTTTSAAREERSTESVGSGRRRRRVAA